MDNQKRDVDGKEGTTTIGLVANDGVVLGSESRATLGNLVAHKKAKKVLPVTDKIAITTAGSVGDAQALKRFLDSEVKMYKMKKEKKPSVSAISNFLANVLFSNRMSMFPFYVQFLVGGWDNSGYHLYSLAPDGSCIEDKYISTGSGSIVAYGLLEDKYEEGMKVEEGKELVARAINAAMERDIYSGNEISLYIIDKGEGLQEVPEEEVKEMVGK